MLGTYHSFEDEDPAPASKTVFSIELHQTKGEDARECGSNTADEVENGESFLDVIFRMLACVEVTVKLLTSSVPAAQQVNTAREITSLENTE